MIPKTSIAVFLVMAALAASALSDSEPIHPCQSYLDLSDEQLFQAATDGNTIGDYCRVKNTPNSSCEFHVTAKPSDLTNYDGWPRTYDDRGRGCVYHPEGKGKCLFLRDDYNHWAEKDRKKMCSGTYVTNAAAQLRHAILNDACGGECALPECSIEHWKPYCYHCRKCKGNMEKCAEGYKFCKLCQEECREDYEKGEYMGAMGDEL